jgi:hypothetical protein
MQDSQSPKGNGGARVKMTQRLRALLKQGKTLLIEQERNGLLPMVEASRGPACPLPRPNWRIDLDK